MAKPKHKTAAYPRPGRRRFTLDLPIELFEKVEAMGKAGGRKPSPQIALLLDEALAIRSLPFFPKIEGLGLIAGHSTLDQISQLLGEALKTRGVLGASPTVPGETTPASE
jgi:hypothetical protein